MAREPIILAIYASYLSGQHNNQCDKATNKNQAREREERVREK